MDKCGKNPKDKNGFPLRCTICESINHFAQECPDKLDNQTYFAGNESCNLVNNEVILLNETDFDHPSTLKTLVAESWNSAVLDSGASRTVCGEKWLSSYIESLSNEERNMIKYMNSSNCFKFGDGVKVQSSKAVEIPAVIGNVATKIYTDVVESDIPLLLSRESMKRASMRLDFNNDTVEVFGHKTNLLVTKSGHYTIPISPYKQLLNNIVINPDISVTLVVQNTKSKKETALKLHRQFAHPSSDKLLKLINSAGEPWCSDQALQDEIGKVSSDCNTCQLYRKSPPRPVVGLPMASVFQECVAMDLKFYKGKIILHLVDHATRLSASTVLPSKNPDVVIAHIYRIWIQVFGAADKFLSDNGGEFANEEFLNMCEDMNILVKTTGAESPFSNGLVERHNLIIAEMLDKVLEDRSISFDVALAWCINAKNSLASVHGFSPFQLALGQNPKLPSTLNNRPPANTPSSTSKVLVENLTALHRAREAFIQGESSEKIRRALSHNVRTSGDVKYVHGDNVYYKRINSRRWRGPARVLGQDGQQVLVKHGSIYCRVHPCRLALQRVTTNNSEKNVPTDTEISPPNKTISHESDSEDEQPIVTTSDTSSAQTQNPVTHEVSREVEVQDVNNNSSGNELPTDANFRNTDLLKKGQLVDLKFDNGSEWMSAKLISRAGKACGKYKHEWNTEFEGEMKPIDFERDVSAWKITEQSDVDDVDNEVCISNIINYTTVGDEFQVNELFLASITEENEKAKLKELQSWKDQQVYEEVEDKGQYRISVRWVLKPKVIDGVMSTKARLCARGFEEYQDFRTDSPTCSRIGIRFALFMITSNGWQLNSIDVKTAFLQGKTIERTVHLKPPREAKTCKLWKLKKCVYGLADASRYWYLRVREELLRLGATISQLDQGIFFWFNIIDELYGIIICFVDDLLWGGSSLFKTNVIDQFRDIFILGSENSDAFTYIGIQITQCEDLSISVNQNSYIDSIKYIDIPSERLKQVNDSITEEERTVYRGAIGQLNWVAGISRPEISFGVCVASTKVKSATVSDMVKVNKIIKQVKTTKSCIKFPKLDLKSLQIKVFADASYNNLPNGGSQGGQMVFLCDSHQNCCPLYWNSAKIKRVVKSTIAAETLSLSEACDTALFISKLIAEALHLSCDANLLITAFTDNRSLYDTLHTSNQVSDKRLRVDISSIRQMVERNEIKISWLNSRLQLSDVLTKGGAPYTSLLDVLKSGKLSIS